MKKKPLTLSEAHERLRGLVIDPLVLKAYEKAVPPRQRTFIREDDDASRPAPAR